MSAIFVYITVSSEDEAKNIAQTVVKDRLAACANIISGMKSIYHWEGKVEEGEEAVLILKTRAELFPALSAKVKELHSYDTPCIAAFPASDIDAGFLKWVLEETKP